MIKVMLVDDQVLLKNSMMYILKQDPELAVHDGGGNGLEAIKNCTINQPDVILMDIMMPQMDGLTAALRIKETYPKVKIIILTTFEDDNNISLALDYGVDGYIVKDVEPEAIILAIKGVHNNLYVIHKSVLSLLKQGVNKKAEEKKMEEELMLIYELTPIEVEIILLIADGQGNKEIAERLKFSEGTMRNKVSRLLGKLELKDRAQIITFAIKNNLF